MLRHYARQFSITELNYTWYQVPRADALERMLPKVPAEFYFTAKLTRTITHGIHPYGWQTEVAQFRNGMLPLLHARRLLAILLQFPLRFEHTRGNRLYLANLFDELDGLPLAIELRHRSWVDERIFQELESRRITLVTVDRPDLPDLFPFLDALTNPDLFYIRLHGRNDAGWRSGNMQKQFDYDYSDEELRVWSEQIIPRMAARARSGVIFFNNHVRAQAPQNALMLADQLSLTDRASGAISL